MNFFLSTLGCPRNQLDSDFIIELLEKGSLRQVFSPSQADFCLVNTCAFIETAKVESLEEIFSFVKRGKKTVVLGCLAQRYGKELYREIPEVDAVVSPDNYPRLPKILKKLASGERVLSYSNKKKFFYQPASRHSTRHYAYLKLTEGCNNRCSFCAIPDVRGSLRSFPVEQLLAKAKKLLALNFKEIILVGQDITAYGLDKGKLLLVPFLNKLTRLEGEFWVRLLYLNPLRVDEELLETIAEQPKILPYFDLPYQHFSSEILKKMGRLYDGETILLQLEKIRKALPEAVIRTTLMVGFPGETEKHFELLLELTKEARFDYVGVFDYSKEEGTKAVCLPYQVPQAIKRERKEKLSFFADELSFERLRRFLGKKVKVLVEGNEGKVSRGRFFAQAPEIDGEVFFPGREKVGNFVTVKLKDQNAFDFQGVIAD